MVECLESVFKCWHVEGSVGVGSCFSRVVECPHSKQVSFSINAFDPEREHASGLQPPAQGPSGFGTRREIFDFGFARGFGRITGTGGSSTVCCCCSNATSASPSSSSSSRQWKDDAIRRSPGSSISYEFKWTSNGCNNSKLLPMLLLSSDVSSFSPPSTSAFLFVGALSSTSFSSLDLW